MSIFQVIPGIRPRSPGALAALPPPGVPRTWRPTSRPQATLSIKPEVINFNQIDDSKKGFVLKFDHRSAPLNYIYFRQRYSQLAAP